MHWDKTDYWTHPEHRNTIIAFSNPFCGRLCQHCDHNWKSWKHKPIWIKTVTIKKDKSKSSENQYHHHSPHQGRTSNVPAFQVAPTGSPGFIEFPFPYQLCVRLMEFKQARYLIFVTDYWDLMELEEEKESFRILGIGVGLFLIILVVIIAINIYQQCQHYHNCHNCGNCHHCHNCQDCQHCH